jgi:uncharacterized repeat protein (TIGR03917 family)
MPIFPPSGNPWRNPYEGRPLATVRQTQHGDHEVTIQPGADVADLVEVLGRVPATSIFTEHYGDVDAVLVFRPIPGVPAGAAPRTPADRGPDAVALAIPTGPIDRAPVGLPSNRFEEALRRALAGVDLGQYDELIVRWLAGWDAPTVATVASLIRRARRAELLTARSL